MDARGDRGRGAVRRRARAAPAALRRHRHVRLGLLAGSQRHARGLCSLRPGRDHRVDPRTADGTGRGPGPDQGQRARGVPGGSGSCVQQPAEGVRARAGGNAGAVRRLREPVREADARSPGAGRLRPGDVSEPRRRRRQRTGAGTHHDGAAGGATGLPDRLSSRSGAAQRARPRARGRALGEGTGRGPGAGPAVSALRAVGHLRNAADRRSALHPADRVRPLARRRSAEGAVRVPIPERGFRADPGAAASRARRRAAGTGDLLDPRGGRDAGVPALARRLLHGDGGADRDQRPGRGHHPLGRFAAARRDCRDGPRAAARVPRTAPAGAARDRAGGGRDHVRRDVAARSLADAGLDRRPADPDRARGRLCDPVSGADRRDGSPSRRAAARRGRDRDGGAGDRRRLPRAAAIARSDGPRFRRAARGRHRGRAGLRTDGGARGPRARGT